MLFKPFSVLVAMMMTFSAAALVLGGTASAYGSDFEYTVTYDWLTDEESIEITGYSGPGGDVIIPSEIDGIPVTSIADGAFNGCDTMTSVTVPDSVTRIGYGAFMMCRSLTTAYIGSGVTILDGTFLLCTALQNVTIGSSVTTIGPNSFAYCFALSSITIPENVTEVETMSFQYCFALQSIYFEGNAPVLSSKWDFQRTAVPAPGPLTAYFYFGSSGFTTPSWSGMPSVKLPRPPSAPLELEIRSGNGSAALSWKAPANDGGAAVDSYAVFMNGTELMITNTTKVNVTGLANEELYTFVVAAHNSAGFGSNSTEELAFPRDGLTTMTLPANDADEEPTDEAGAGSPVSVVAGLSEEQRATNQRVMLGGLALISIAAVVAGLVVARQGTSQKNEEGERKE